VPWNPKNRAEKRMPAGKRKYDSMFEARSAGGKANLLKHGREFYQQISRAGGAATKEKYGRDYYVRIGQLGGMISKPNRNHAFKGWISAQPKEVQERVEAELARRLEEKAGELKSQQLAQWEAEREQREGKEVDANI